MESEQQQGYLSLLRFNRGQAIQLFVVALVLAIGVDLLATYVADHVSSLATLVLAAVFIITGALVIVGRVLRPRPRVRHFEGFFIYDEDANELAEHDLEYRLGYSLTDYLRSAFAEDPSTKMIWQRNPISQAKEGLEAKGRAEKSLDLVRQAAEYYVLESLSTRVSDHFRSGDFDHQELDTLSHRDIPDVLLQNRFLRLFAEPMEDRAAFSERDNEDPEGWTVVMASGEGGARYSRFELVLPKGWRVKRSGGKTIEFDARRFTLSIHTDCEGWGELLPFGYISDYLGLNEGAVGRYSAMQVIVTIRIAPRRAWMVGPKGWRYYRWIDDWIADLESEIDRDAYLERIGYAGAETALKLLRTWRRQQSKQSEFGDRETRESASDRALDDPDQRRSAPNFAVGDQVEHASFGLGVVIDEEPPEIVTVEFEDDGSKRKLFTPIAPLRSVGPQDGDHRTT